MDGKGFFLGLIAAVVLFLLWKKENGPSMSFSFPGLTPAPANPTGDGAGGCAGCGGPGGCAGCGGSPSYASAPAYQGGAAAAASTAGQISPGTPPLQTAAGAGSFYAVSGPTPDNSFTNYPAKPVSTVLTFIPKNPAAPSNVPSSPSTPATNVPPRSIAIVPPYAVQGFQQRYNVAGVPQRVMSTAPTQYSTSTPGLVRPTGLPVYIKGVA